MARDADNFTTPNQQIGLKCQPIVLRDGTGTLADLVCASGMLHAHNGATVPTASPGTKWPYWQEVKNAGWQEKAGKNNNGLTWDEFKKEPLKRGYKLMLGRLAGDGFGFLHYQTVLEDGTGETAVTYAGNAGSAGTLGTFRRETASQYYRFYGNVEEKRRRIKILLPPP